MLFSTSGFQEGAIRLARAHGIATITVLDGRWLYKTKSVGPPQPPPAWIKLPRFAAERLSPTEDGWSSHRIDDEQVDAISEFLNNDLSEQPPNEGAAGDGQDRAAPERPMR